MSDLAPRGSVTSTDAVAARKVGCLKLTLRQPTRGAPPAMSPQPLAPRSPVVCRDDASTRSVLERLWSYRPL